MNYSWEQCNHHCSKSKKQKGSLQEPGHLLWIGSGGALEIGPKSDSWKEWLISIFTGPQAVIQRADGTLYNRNGGKEKREIFFREGKLRKSEGFIQIHCRGCFVFRGHSGTSAWLVCPFCLQHLSKWLIGCWWESPSALQRAFPSFRLSSIVKCGSMEESQPPIGSLRLDEETHPSSLENYA